MIWAKEAKLLVSVILLAFMLQVAYQCSRPTIVTEIVDPPVTGSLPAPEGK